MGRRSDLWQVDCAMGRRAGAGNSQGMKTTWALRRSRMWVTRTLDPFIGCPNEHKYCSNPAQDQQVQTEALDVAPYEVRPVVLRGDEPRHQHKQHHPYPCRNEHQAVSFSSQDCARVIVAVFLQRAGWNYLNAADGKSAAARSSKKDRRERSERPRERSAAPPRDPPSSRWIGPTIDGELPATADWIARPTAADEGALQRSRSTPLGSSLAAPEIWYPRTQGISQDKRCDVSQA